MWQISLFENAASIEKSVQFWNILTLYLLHMQFVEEHACKPFFQGTIFR